MTTCEVNAKNESRADLSDVLKVKISRVHGGCPGTGADEGRGDRRNGTGSWKRALIRPYPNGETPRA